MRNRFDMQLENLSVQLITMGNLCEKAIANATEALKKGDLELAKLVIREDQEIDQMEKEIETMCLKLLLQQQPVAKDLRQISAALKMITDMERIGDQTSDIAEIIISAGMSAVKDMNEIARMAEATSQMVHDSVLAYVSKDLTLAYKVMEADDKVDELFDCVKRKLVKVIANEHEHIGERAIDMMMITKYLERIGDHATNIAEWVEFSLTGVHRDSAAVSV
ncbi:MAG: phosphate signaling complex protein PhoU [Tyzzerella sp.]|nr:phosphate signaling complex protein PhoU [Tyzzerella sp.]